MVAPCMLRPLPSEVTVFSCAPVLATGASQKAAVLDPCFWDQNDRQRRISTKETNNEKAFKILTGGEDHAGKDRLVQHGGLSGP
jgi:hypothetical protein